MIVGKVEIDKYSFIIDGKRIIARTAAVHYFRIPGEQTWIDRLTKLKYAGYNTIDMYLNWGYHSEKPGQYDFTGIKDIGKLIAIAEEIGLYVVARPGPYINAEVSAGGFPGWILSDQNVILRNRKDNDFVYSKDYMKYVRDWYEKIIPIINQHKNVIAVQVENEYSTNEAEPDYMQELIDIVRELGCKLPILHNDMYAAGLYEDLVDIYAIDNYSVTYFEQPWQSFPEVFAILDEMEENLRMYSQDSPMFIAELQAGWFDKWGGEGYDKIRNMLGREHIDIVTKTSLAQGVTAFTHYMGCGGTNWGNLGSTEVYTSYDFASPITEQGTPTDRFYAARLINNLLQSFDLSQTKLAENQPEIKTVNPSSRIVYWTRENLKDGSRWLFIRNDSLGNSSVSINGEFDVEIDPQEMLILPSNLKINDLMLKYSTLPMMARLENKTTQIIFPKTDYSGELVLDIPDDSKVTIINKSKNLQYDREGNIVTINYNKSDDNEIHIIDISNNKSVTRFVFLPQSVKDYMNIINNSLIIGPQFITNDNGALVVANDTEKDIIRVDHNGGISTYTVDAPEKVGIINLQNWSGYKIAPEINESELGTLDWAPVQKRLDADSNGIYDGYFWYKVTCNQKLNKLSFNARHCFALYLNGEEIYAHDSFESVSGEDFDDTVVVDLEMIKQSETNTYVLLVQSMGHNKGFEDDADNPRGLLSYKTSPEVDLNWQIKPALSAKTIENESLSKLNSVAKSDRVVCYVNEFKFCKPEKHQIPLGLVFNQPGFNKASIYLNDVLIGHYWGDKGPQTRFYLPEIFYNQDGSANTIKLVVWYRSIDNDTKYTRRLNDVSIYIEPYGVYKLTEIKELE